MDIEEDDNSSIASSSRPLALPASPYYEIRDTSYSGRGVFATQRIPAGTHLHSADDLSAAIIYRDYRREVCIRCFAYDRGVSWPLRDPTLGLVFCSKTCRNAWFERHDKLVVKAHQAVEALLKSRPRKDADDDAMLDISKPVDAPRTAEIERVWKLARNEGRKIVAARTSLQPMKAELKALRGALSRPCDPGVLPYLLSAVVVAYNEPEKWEAVLELKPTPTPYKSSSELESHITAYHQLLAILPDPLLIVTTPAVLQTSVDRDAHNSFGLRSLDDDGDEMYGFGVWASASYWNHNCAPNLDKRREGRVWHFWTSRDIEEGEELCITYLGTDTKTMPLKERRAKLMETWAFTCMCQRCRDENETSASHIENKGQQTDTISDGTNP